MVFVRTVHEQLFKNDTFFSKRIETKKVPKTKNLLFPVGL
jgi:hypothetical protein